MATSRLAKLSSHSRRPDLADRPDPVFSCRPEREEEEREREREREREKRDQRKAREFVFLKDVSRAWINFVD
jgi:hypothetical protein